MAHFGLRLGCWQRDCSATNGGPPELDHSNKGTGSSIRVDALCWVPPGPLPPSPTPKEERERGGRRKKKEKKRGIAERANPVKEVNLQA